MITATRLHDGPDCRKDQRFPNLPLPLDPALIRAGRIDERVELGYADEDQLRRLYLKFHDDPAAAAEFAHQNAGQSRAPAAVQGELMSRLGAKRV